jgi:DNA-binding NarL/FixJ family response regulator
MRVVIAEDSVLLREGLAQLLQSVDIDVAASVGDADALLLVDVRMPPGHSDEGLRAALVLRQRWPAMAVLVLSQYVEERYAVELLTGDTRGIGYLLKDRVADVAEFLDGLRRVATGGTALDPEVVSQLLVRHRNDPLDRLTPRERDVLALMAEGRSNGGIATALRLSDSAVAKHVSRIFTKLDLAPVDNDHRRVLAVLRFLQSGQSSARPGGNQP